MGQSVWMHCTQASLCMVRNDFSGLNSKVREVFYTNPQGPGLSGEMFYSQTLALRRNLKPQMGKCTLCVQGSKKEKGEAGDEEEDDPGHSLSLFAFNEIL